MPTTAQMQYDDMQNQMYRSVLGQQAAIQAAKIAADAQKYGYDTGLKSADLTSGRELQGVQDTNASRLQGIQAQESGATSREGTFSDKTAASAALNGLFLDRTAAAQALARIQNQGQLDVARAAAGPDQTRADLAVRAYSEDPKRQLIAEFMREAGLGPNGSGASPAPQSGTTPVAGGGMSFKDFMAQRAENPSFSMASHIGQPNQPVAAVTQAANSDPALKKLLADPSTASLVYGILGVPNPNASLLADKQRLREKAIDSLSSPDPAIRAQASEYLRGQGIDLGGGGLDGKASGGQPGGFLAPANPTAVLAAPDIAPEVDRFKQVAGNFAKANYGKGHSTRYIPASSYGGRVVDPAEVASAFTSLKAKLSNRLPPEQLGPVMQQLASDALLGATPDGGFTLPDMGATLGSTPTDTLYRDAARQLLGQLVGPR